MRRVIDVGLAFFWIWFINGVALGVVYGIILLVNLVKGI